MYAPIPQAVACRVVLRAFSDRNRPTDEVGQTLVVTLSKNGGTFLSPSGGLSAVEMGNGWYYKDLSTTDTNTLGPLVLRATGSHIYTIEPHPFYVRKATNGDWSALPDAAAQAAGGLFTRGTGAGQINQDANGRIDTRWVAGDVTVGTNGDKTGYALTAAYDLAKTAAQAGDAMTLTSGERSILSTSIWAASTRTLTSFGSLVTDIWAAVVDSPGVTTLLSRLTAGRASNLDNLDVPVSSRLAAADYDVPLGIDDPRLDYLDVAVSSRLATAGYTAPDNATILAIKDDTEDILALGGGGGGGGPSLEEIKATMVEVMAEDTYPEPGQEIPPTPTSLAYMLRWLYKFWRNKQNQTNSLTQIFSDDNLTVDLKAINSFDGTTYQREKFQAGP